MPEKEEKIIRAVYRQWKAGHEVKDGGHLDEETFVAFLEHGLPSEEQKHWEAHILVCEQCAQILALSLKVQPLPEKELPEALVQKTKALLAKELGFYFLDIILLLKEKTLEIINTTGDILMGQELVPAAVLRSRQSKDFPDEVTILKDFQDIRVEVKIENQKAQAFNLTVLARDKQTQNIIKDLRVTLLKGDLELESYLTDTGKVTFEHILLGKYTVEITTINEKVATILLDIKV